MSAPTTSPRPVSLWLGSLALTLWLATACASSMQDLGTRPIQPRDVVVPDGMTLRTDQSHSREIEGWRYGDLFYTGQIRLADACSHLLLRMPQHRWQLVTDEEPSRAERNLRFVRGRYVADYRLARLDGVTRMKVELRTEIIDQ